jgi:hypothetical protein
MRPWELRSFEMFDPIPLESLDLGLIQITKAPTLVQKLGLWMRSISSLDHRIVGNGSSLGLALGIIVEGVVVGKLTFS